MTTSDNLHHERGGQSFELLRHNYRLEVRTAHDKTQTVILKKIRISRFMFLSSFRRLLKIYQCLLIFRTYFCVDSQELTTRTSYLYRICHCACLGHIGKRGHGHTGRDRRTRTDEHGQLWKRRAMFCPKQIGARVLGLNDYPKFLLG